MPTPRKKTKPKRKPDQDVEKGTTLRPDEMSPDVVEFITAMDDYKRLNQRPFPNWSEVLDVVKRLGYVRPKAQPRA